MRIQARADHASGPAGVDGALALIGAATRGHARSTRLNDNPPDTAWRADQAGNLRWAPSEVGSLNRMITDTLVTLLMEVP